MDVLSDVLGSLGLAGKVFCQSELTAPWSLALPAGTFAHFHYVERGVCHLRLEERQAELRLSAGDLVVLPHGRGHLLHDGSARRAVSIRDLTRNCPPGRCALVKHGGGGDVTRLLCGSFQFRRHGEAFLMPLLPDVLHVPGGPDETAQRIEDTLRVLGAEAVQARPGGEAVLSRLVEILFVYVLRWWLAHRPDGPGNWLGALADPAIGRSLGLIHARPEEAWTVERMARSVNMSRSPFAARFRQRVGDSPLSYLARWRMLMAEDLLARSDLRLSEIAIRIGYSTEAAFSKAFRRRHGQAPNAYRRRTRKGTGS
jgi:AraC-like DNA-binding protein